MKPGRCWGEYRIGRRTEDSPSILIVCLAAVLLLCSPALLPADEPQVLTVRPEKIGSPADDPNPRQLRDPFNWSREQITLFNNSRPREKRNSVAGLTLTGIIFDRNHPLATINDRLVSTGDLIDGSVILEIMEDLVIFEQNGVPHSLWLDPLLMNLSPGN